MENEMSLKGTKTVEIGGRFVSATWVGVVDLEIGRSMVVHGPDSGAWWRDENSVSVVRAIEVVGDRTNTRVVTSTDDESENSGSWGGWSSMRFLVVDSPNEIPC
jgi:hypothetical protein